MRIRIISYTKESFRKILTYIYIIVIGVGIAMMIKGPVGGGESFYSKWDAPIWLYILTSVFLFFMTIMMFANIFTGVPGVGFMTIDNEGVEIEKGRRKKRINLSSIQDINVLSNFLKDKVDASKNNRIIQITLIEGIEKYDILLSKKEEKELNDLITSLFQ